LIVDFKVAVTPIHPGHMDGRSRYRQRRVLGGIRAVGQSLIRIPRSTPVGGPLEIDLPISVAIIIPNRIDIVALPCSDISSAPRRRDGRNTVVVSQPDIRFPLGANDRGGAEKQKSKEAKEHGST
jgi:hypothetical protein